MNSTLTPREIQARIRSGETLEEVAAAAGAPVEKIEPFADPILREREYVASIALTSPLRRVGEQTGHRTLRTVTSEGLLTLGVDPESVDWDAWREMDKKWIVTAAWADGEQSLRAEFRYDQLGRFSLARNETAKALTGELRRGRAERSSDPDAEPTVDFSDEFAIVRAVGAETPPEQQVGDRLVAALAPGAGDHASAIAESEHETAPEAALPAPTAAALAARSGDDEMQDATSDEQPGREADELDPDAWAGAQLTDGVYDIVPGRGELDNLYEMFHSFAEDSVEIYPGLGEVRPVGPPPGPLRKAPELALVALGEPIKAVDEDAHVEPPDAVGEAAVPASVASEAEREEDAEAVVDVGMESAVVGAGEQAVEVEDAEVAAEPKQPATVAEIVDAPVEEEPVVASRPLPQEPLQEALVEETQVLPRSPRATKKKRASVPSWDEIMFGGPRP